MISIKYNPKQDLKNWLKIKQKYIDDFSFTKFYPFNRDIELNHVNFDLILETISQDKIEKFKQQAIVIKKEWERIENKIIQKITDYLKIPFEKFNLKVSLTTAFLMPYDYKDKWFMVPTHKKLNEQIKCIIHELFHFYHIKKNPSVSQKELEKEVQKFLTKFY